MNPIKILSRHSNLRDAVNLAIRLGTMSDTVEGVDFSYNEQAANEAIKHIDRGSNHPNHPIKPCDLAFVCERAGKIEIYHLTRADINILNKFSPFISCLDDSKLRIIKHEGETLSLMEGISFTKSAMSRKVIQSLQKSIPELYAF